MSCLFGGSETRGGFSEIFKWFYYYKFQDGRYKDKEGAAQRAVPPLIPQEANEIIYFFGLDSGGTIPLAR